MDKNEQRPVVEPVQLKELTISDLQNLQNTSSTPKLLEEYEMEIY